MTAVQDGSSTVTEPVVVDKVLTSTSLPSSTITPAVTQPGNFMGIDTGSEFPGTGTGINLSPNPLISVASELGAQVPIATCEKIWSNEYVDLSKLLYCDPSDSAQNQQQLYVDPLDGEIKIKQKQKERKITNISEWTDAFLIYMAIYIKRYPDHTQGLLKYFSTIRTGAARTAALGWRDYDIQFRLRRAKNSSLWWGSVDAELWLLYMNAAVASAPANPSTTYNARRLKCFDYNFKGVCSRNDCKFLHACLKCHLNHPSSNCNKQTGQYPANPRQPNPVRGNFPQQPFRMPGHQQTRNWRPSFQ